jgi:protein O-mannosyl-transferase
MECRSQHPVCLASAQQIRTTVFLLVVIAIAWAPALGAAFHYDDLPNVVMDPATSDPAALADRLSNGFRPLLRLSYAADHLLWGFAPAGFIATNLVLHSLTVLGVAALARRRLGGETAVALAAMIFALQPAHAAAVAWTSGRSTLLATALMVAAMLAHERAAGSVRWRGVSLLAMTLAVLAKETALVLPALLLLWEATRPSPSSPREIIRRVAPAAVTAVLLTAITVAFSTRLQEILAFSVALSSPGEALATNAAALPISLSLWWRPWALSVEHPQAFTTTATVGGVAVLLAMVLCATAAMRARATLVALALLWPIVALLPTHSFLARLDPVTEKALYPAWIGPSFALGAACAYALARLPRLRPVLAASLVLLLVALSSWRASVWADPAALWREASLRVPQSARAWSNRALAELDAGQAAHATQSIARAEALAPDDERVHDAALAISLALPFTEEPKR